MLHAIIKKTLSQAQSMRKFYGFDGIVSTEFFQNSLPVGVHRVDADRLSLLR